MHVYCAPEVAASGRVIVIDPVTSLYLALSCPPSLSLSLPSVRTHVKTAEPVLIVHFVYSKFVYTRVGSSALFFGYTFRGS